MGVAKTVSNGYMIDSKCSKYNRKTEMRQTQKNYFTIIQTIILTPICKNKSN